jgi:hypothetical protein
MEFAMEKNSEFPPAGTGIVVMHRVIRDARKVRTVSYYLHNATQGG